uniref:Putative secreted protein n=1 Tax=Ixodes ricinus TaxID=34613 RepID=A0A6B0UUE9_IXORI
MKASYFLASFLTSFLFLLSFLRASVSMHGRLLALASSQCCWSPKTHTWNFGRGMCFSGSCREPRRPLQTPTKLLLVMVLPKQNTSPVDFKDPGYGSASQRPASCRAPGYATSHPRMHSPVWQTPSPKQRNPECLLKLASTCGV